MLLFGYALSPFRDFESYLRIVVRLDEDDNLFFEKNNSISVFHEIPPGIFLIQDISEVDYTMSDHEGTLRIELDDFSMITKPILTDFC